MKDFTKLHDVILNAAHHIPEKICMQVHTSEGWYRYTYAGLRQRVHEGARILKELGVCAGDRIILLTENCPDAMIAFLAVLAADAVAVMIDPALSAVSINDFIAQTESRALLVSERYFNNLTTLVPHVAVRHIQKHFAPCEGYATETSQHFKTSYFTDADVAAILYTSGTTGVAKGVMLTHDNFIQEITECQITCDATQDDRMLTVLPIHHISPLMQTLMGLYIGLTSTCVEKLEGSVILKAMQETQPTIVGFVPLIFEAFLREIENKIRQQSTLNQMVVKTLFSVAKNIRQIIGYNIGFHLFNKIQRTFGGQMIRMISGGAPLNPAILTKLEAYGFTILEAYGLTETTGPICSNRLGQKKKGTAGIPHPNTQIRIIDDEICIRGPFVMKGYFKDPEATSKVLKDGWLHTGDLGFLDQDGFLKLTGRNREMIVLSSGKKVIPTELEQHYQMIPGVKEITVFGVPGPQGEQIHAAIVIDTVQKEVVDEMVHAQKKSIAELIYQKNSTLPSHHHIQFIYFMDAIPKTTSFKIKRSELKNKVMKKEIQPFELGKKAESQRQPLPVQSLSALPIETFIQEWIAHKKNIALHQVDKDKTFHFYGMDSLSVVALCEDLEKKFNQKVHPALFWEHPTIARLAAHIVSPVSKQSIQEHKILQEPIAIVGMSCRFPGNITNPEAFWDLMLQGRSGIQEVPTDRWDNAEFYDANPDAPGKISSRFGGFLPHIDQFDPHFFEIAPFEADNMDPQHRLLLELSWEALERSGINPDSLAGTSAGVYVGICTSDYGMIQAQAQNAESITPYYGLGNSLSAAAGRIAYFLGLQGICKAIDTACSSSLVALHDACQDLQMGRSHLSIVAGVNAILSPYTSISFSKARMLASDGHCKVFDVNADGYVRSEGCGVVILKRLSDAQKDRDPILAVIKSVAVNQDGRSNGITAPNGDAQTRLFQQALHDAALAPADIQYIEAHGTGTSLGDPIESRSIASVYSSVASNSQSETYQSETSKSEINKSETPLYLGSVKSHIGHLEAAAGIAGLIKSILILKHRKIPAQIHFNQLNPFIQFDQTRIQIPRETIDLSSVKKPLHAAVNAFGFTGTNVQIILSEYSKDTSSDQHSAKSYHLNHSAKSHYLITLSAKTEKALQDRIDQLKNWLNLQNKISLSDFSLSNLSYTLNSGRKHFNKRFAAVVDSLASLQNALTDATIVGVEHKGSVKQLKDCDGPNYSSRLIALSKWYLQGYDLDWEELHQNENGQKIILPTYPFQHQTYWFKKSKTIPKTIRAQGIHPFLSSRIVTPSVKDIIFEAVIDATWPSYIKDHQIYEMPVVAGASYLSTLFTFWQHQFKGSNFCLENFVIQEPLILMADEERILQTIFYVKEKYFEMVSCDKQAKNTDNPLWITHVKGTLKENAELNTAAFEDLAIIQQRCLNTFSAEKLYCLASELGMQYQNQFQGVKKILLGTHEALVELHDADELTDDLPPGLLDSCFQGLFAILSQTKLNELRIPVGIRQWMMLRNRLPKWAHIKITKNSAGNITENNPANAADSNKANMTENNPANAADSNKANMTENNPANVAESNTADFVFYDHENQIIGTMAGFCVKPVSKNRLLKKFHREKNENDNVFYELTWKVSALQNAKKIAASTGHWIIFSSRPEEGEALRQSLSFAPDTIWVTSRIEELQQKCLETAKIQGIIYLSPWMENKNAISSSQLKKLQEDLLTPLISILKNHLQNKNHAPFWIVSSDFVFQSTLLGLFRAVTLEHPEASCRYLACDTKDKMLFLKTIAEEISHESDETQVIYRDGVRTVARLQQQEKAKKDRHELTIPESAFFHLNIPERGRLQNLQLHPVQSFENLAPQEVVLEVKAAGLNFRDVLNALDLYPGDPGPLGGDCAGIVKAVGEQVKDLKVGDRVMGFAISGAFANYALSHADLLSKMPQPLSYQDAATVPTVFLTAYYAFNRLAKLKAGEKVLIHAASGGVGIAAIQLAKLAGTIIFATAGSDTKRQYLKSLGVQHIYNSRSLTFAEQILADTEGAGVDVVLNSLSGEGFIEKTVEICAPNARFLEIGKRDIWSKEKMTQKRADIHYHVIALDDLIRTQSQVIQSLFHDIAPLFISQQIQPLPVTLFPITQAISAFRYMQQAQHIGKIVLVTEPVAIKAQASYLITGGLGALGLQLAAWLGESGATHIVLAGRHLPNENTKQKLAELRQRFDFTLEIHALDVADDTSVKNVLAKFGREFPELKGIIHAAGALYDKLFLEQEWHDFEKVFAAKVYGAWNLHQFSVNHSLDFFVLFSSIASTFGSPGQSNYAAANMFLDHLAVYRQELGLPALSINWGPWSESGMAAGLQNVMAARGVSAIKPDEGCRWFGRVLQQDHSQVVIAPVNWHLMSKNLAVFPQFLAEIAFKNTAGEQETLLVLLQKAPELERAPILRQGLRKLVCSVMGIQAHQLEDQSDFDKLGMDSLMALELNRLLENELSADVQGLFASTSQNKNIECLTKHIMEKIFPEENQAHSASGQAHSASGNSYSPSDHTDSRSSQSHSSSANAYASSRQTHSSSGNAYASSRQTHSSSGNAYASSRQTHSSPDQAYSSSDHQPDIKRALSYLSAAEVSKIEAYFKKLTHPNWFANISKSMVRQILRFLCKFYFRIEIKGLENLPTNKAYIICPNHTSYLDSVVLGSVSKKLDLQFVGLLAEDYFSKASFPLISMLMDVVPFDRSRNEQALEKNLKYIELCKIANRVLILFPEGTRSKDGRLQEFKNGVAWFAEKTQLEVIPAYIDGGYRLLPRGRFFPKPGKLTITFGEVLHIAKENSPSFSGVQFYQHMTQKLRECILKLENQFKFKGKSSS